MITEKEFLTPYKRVFSNNPYEEGIRDTTKKVIGAVTKRFKSSEIDKLDKALANQVKINKKLSSKDNKTDADKKALQAGKVKSSQLRKQIADLIKKSNAQYEKNKKNN